MKIQTVEKLNSGYYSIKSIAKLKGFIHPHGGKIIIPENYFVVTDGKLFNILKK
jgi:hypothetical protein